MKRRVLIIEAHDPTLFLLTFILERDGCEVLAARGGPEGLDVARRVRPDLVLVGRAVNGADPLVVARHLRDDVDLAHAPVVAVVDTPDEGPAAAHAGCAGWIETPIIPARLRAQLAAFLDAETVPAPLPPAPAGRPASSA